MAELYDRYRPTYPDALVDDIVSLADLDGTRATLEVGAGTGKATVMFAARGIPVVGIEPNVEMAAVARRNCLEYPGVAIEQGDFERWDPHGRSFPLVFSAQAWHWVEPAAGYAKARSVLSPGGLFAAFWNRFAWEHSELRDELTEAYLTTAPAMTSAGGMHPVKLHPDADADWEGEISAVDGLGEAEARHYEWEWVYSTSEYVGLLATASDVRMLDEVTREALLAAVTAVIEGHGGTGRMRMCTRLCLARRLTAAPRPNPRTAHTASGTRRGKRR